jgi:hypothetical protein
MKRKEGIKPPEPQPSNSGTSKVKLLPIIGEASSLFASPTTPHTGNDPDKPPAQKPPPQPANHLRKRSLSVSRKIHFNITSLTGTSFSIFLLSVTNNQYS